MKNTGIKGGVGNMVTEIDRDRLSFLPQEKIEKIILVCSSVEVPERISNPHRLIKETDKYLRSKNRYNYPNKDDVLSIYVSENLINRSLIIMDTIIKAIEKLGYSMMNTHNNTRVIIEGQDIKIKLCEKSYNVPHVLTSDEKESIAKGYDPWIHKYDSVLSGELTLTIDEYHAKRKNWKDGKNRRLENCISDFIFTIIITSEELRIVREAFAERDRKWKEEREKRTLSGKIHKEELEKIEDLMNRAKDYNDAMVIINYINAMEKVLNTISNKEERIELQEYITWAKEKSDWLNPLINRDDPILGKRKRGEI